MAVCNPSFRRLLPMKIPTRFPLEEISALDSPLFPARHVSCNMDCQPHDPLHGTVSPPFLRLGSTMSPLHPVSDSGAVPAYLAKAKTELARQKAPWKAKELGLWSLREFAVLDTLCVRGTAHTCSNYRACSGRT